MQNQSALAASEKSNSSVQSRDEPTESLMLSREIIIFCLIILSDYV